jgi:Methylene-tetrahydrofolate reductase C terminal
VSDSQIDEFCSLCGECVVEYTGGLCPMTLCAKGLLNGPCGGAENGMCEADRERECGWISIYERLKKLGRLDLIESYREPKNYAKWSHPRSLQVSPEKASFCSHDGARTVSNRN